MNAYDIFVRHVAQSSFCRLRVRITGLAVLKAYYGQNQNGNRSSVITERVASWIPSSFHVIALGRQVSTSKSQNSNTNKTFKTWLSIPSETVNNNVLQSQNDLKLLADLIYSHINSLTSLSGFLLELKSIFPSALRWCFLLLWHVCREFKGKNTT